MISMYDDVQRLIASEKVGLAYNKQKLKEMEQTILSFSRNLSQLAIKAEKYKFKAPEGRKLAVESIISLCKKQIPKIKRDINDSKKRIAHMYYFWTNE